MKKPILYYYKYNWMSRYFILASLNTMIIIPKEMFILMFMSATGFMVWKALTNFDEVSVCIRLIFFFNLFFKRFFFYFHFHFLQEL